MENLFRFSDYDLFACVATGLAALVAWDLALETHFVLAADWTISTGVATIGFAYIAGQIIAAPAAFLIEKLLLARFVGAPSKILFNVNDTPVPTFLKRSILRGYFLPLAEDIQRRVLKRASLEGKATTPGEGLFWAAFPAAKKDRDAYPRMMSFLKLYGFCRNMSFVGLMSSILFAGEWLWGTLDGRANAHFLQWSGASLFIGAGMLLRFFTYYRLYSVEVFVSYSEGLPTK